MLEASSREEAEISGVADVYKRQNPGKPKINWFAPADDAVAAVHIKDGKYDETTSNPSVVYGGKVSDNKVENLKVVAYEGTEGAIYAEGAGTDVTVDTASVSYTPLDVYTRQLTVSLDRQR